jgi:hypothetical protein
MQPVVTLPEAGDVNLAVVDDAAQASEGTTTPTAGPLAMPRIGVVAPDFDEQYAALPSASPSPAPAPATEDRNTLVDLVLPVDEPTRPAPTPGPSQPAAPTPTPSQPSVTPPPTSEPTDGNPTDDGSTNEDPPAETPPTDAPPSDAPPSDAPPTEEPPAEAPPSEAPPTEAPPTEAPPTEQPPVEDPPAELTLGAGETFDVVDAASGSVLFSIAVDSVTADLPCTAEGHQPAKNGHFVGLAVRVTTGPARPEVQPTAIRPGAFRVVGLGNQDVATHRAATCLPAAEQFPETPLSPDQEVTGTVVLDVPDATGTIGYRPADGATRLLWQF